MSFFTWQPNVPKAVSFAVPKDLGEEQQALEDEAAPKPKRRRTNMTEVRARAARHKGQLNFQSDCELPPPHAGCRPQAF